MLNVMNRSKLLNYKLVLLNVGTQVDTSISLAG